MRIWISFGLTLNVCAFAAAAPTTRNERREQQQAVEAIQRLGGQVMYEYQKMETSKPNTYDPKATPKDPIGFSRVIFVGFRDLEVRDNDLELLYKLPYVE